MDRFFRYATGCVLFLIYFIAYRGVLSHVIFYHEQHHLFLFSRFYFQQRLQSEGLLSYLTDFVIQFFYYPVVGSAILAFLLVAVFVLSGTALSMLTGKKDILNLPVIPSMCLFFYTMSVDHSLSAVVGAVIFLLLVNLCLWWGVRFSRLPFSFLSRFHLPKGKMRLALWVLPLALYTGLGYYGFLRMYNIKERIMLKSEQVVKEKDWEKVVEYTSRYLNSGRTNQLITYFHHLAQAHLGQLPYTLFDYPQLLGVKGLYFPWNSDSRESEYGHYLYENLGYINEAQRWEFEAMVVWGETAPHLLNLIRYNIVNNRPSVAQRFINKLKLSLFYADEACRLEGLLQEGSLPELKNALKDVEDIPARFANVLNIGPELEYLCVHNPDNQMAFEYLMSYLLLGNQVVRFVGHLDWLKRYSYASLPPAYEEALFIYKLRVGEEEFAQTGFTVSPETERRFARYYQLVQNKQMKTLQEEFGHTYWFYLNYVSPYGNKVIVN